MRENNRKPIEKCIKKLPQFTTMNVIDGQAGLVIYSSLIFYSLTIDNILNIIILLILAGISISLLTGDNGILTQAVRAKEETEKAQENEMIILEKYNQYLNNTVGISAKDISKLTDKTNVYGAEVKGYDDYINKKDEIWRLFYADEKNIYLIASDYISYDNIPTNDAGHKPNIGSYSKARKFFKYTRRL